jgi:hypothetical protein
MSTCALDLPKLPLQFNRLERRHLLSSPGLGPVVVDRLERSGIASIERLRILGVDAVVESMCQPGHNRAWFNRRRALLRAVDQFGQ